jgi:hypothetical protein
VVRLKSYYFLDSQILLKISEIQISWKNCIRFPEYGFVKNQRKSTVKM